MGTEIQFKTMKTKTPETDAAKAWLGKSNTPQPPMHAPVVPAALAEKLERERDEWKKCAEDLVDYAHDFVSHLSTWKGYDRWHDKQIKQAEDAIEVYVNLKNRNSDKI
jgi:hypothetical protein